MKISIGIEDFAPSLDDIAFVLFRSSLPGYAFADSLNRLYDLDFHRIDDIDIDGTPSPFYTHYDTTRHLHYFLVESKDTTICSPGDKLLLVKGENAPDMAQYISDDFSSPAKPDPADLLAQQHAELLDELLADFTVASLVNADQPQGLSRKAAREHARLQDHYFKILDYIEEHHLDLSESERSHLNDILVANIR